jgi:hypothetical protein
VKTQYLRLKDRKYIDVTNPQTLHEQSLYLGKSPPEVAYAVSQVGPEMDAVAAFLGA